LRLRREPQLKINPQGEIFKMLNTNTENLRPRREPQLKINSEISELQSETKQNVDSVMTVQDAIEQDVDSVMTVQDAIEQNERDEKIDILSRIR